MHQAFQNQQIILQKDLSTTSEQLWLFCCMLSSRTVDSDVYMQTWAVLTGDSWFTFDCWCFIVIFLLFLTGGITVCLFVSCLFVGSWLGCCLIVSTNAVSCLDALVSENYSLHCHAVVIKLCSSLCKKCCFRSWGAKFETNLCCRTEPK